MFLLNSCLDLFSAACSRRHPFSRSYGVILPSSLTMLLPSALGFSPHPPVSVYGTGSYITIAAFLDGWLTCFATLWFATHHVFPLPEGFASLTGTSLAPVFPFPGQAFQPCPYSSEYMKYRNLHLLSIDYGFRPRLRSRLTQSRSALLSGNLRYSAVRILTLLSLLIPAFSLPKSPQLLSVLLRSFSNAPLPII